MKHSFRKISLLFSLVLLSTCLVGCRNKQFTPHEAMYGGETEETITAKQFFSLRQANYKKSNDYKNGYATLTSNKSFRGEEKVDPDDYFGNFTELRFFVRLDDDDYNIDQLFTLLPVNFDGYLWGSPYAINACHAGRSVSFLIQNIKISSDSVSTTTTFYQYKIKGDNIEILFSEDYYPVKATWTFESANFEMNFRYFNVGDLPNPSSKVDKETFLIHAYARANQRLTVNYLKLDLVLENAVINYYHNHHYDKETDSWVTYYVYGSGTATSCYKLISLGSDKTAFAYYNYSKFSGKISYESFSAVLSEEMHYVNHIYFDPIRDYVFNTYSSISDAINNYQATQAEIKYSVSPLRIEKRQYNNQKNQYEIYKYEYDENGLLVYYSINLNDETLPNEATYTFTYSEVFD